MGLRFADPRAQAVLQTLLVFRLLPAGFTNREIRELVGPLLGKQAQQMTAGQMTYDDVAPPRAYGLIIRLPHSRCYRVTDTGRGHALFLTRAHDRLLGTGPGRTQRPEPGPLKARQRQLPGRHRQAR